MVKSIWRFNVRVVFAKAPYYPYELPIIPGYLRYEILLKQLITSVSVIIVI